ncbi:(2Fe-2S)-binding protein [Synechococcus sp. CS-1328]|uniref:2Fe-2S iron-sulfur cluster-binding protein n=1 Tax=Synechococcus sp. CS-1328 TaxID=2847976 RepID=UPI00223BCDF4|nr:(2Fe-2S)-binding protein [Synechococcus sp. CS-1328]MCT0225566.1 (2Fe-2S)-binding protein [Synechococcus sp. CS-1328]
MPVIRFVREGQDVECYPGENLREVALRQGLELYGLKGKLGNCGGCGQCITCFVEIVEDPETPSALSPLTAVEEQKLRSRPQGWRLACQTLVNRSVLVLTRPQVGLPDRDLLLAQASQQLLPEGPTAWPAPPEPIEVPEEIPADDALTDMAGSDRPDDPQPG